MPPLSAFGSSTRTTLSGTGPDGPQHEEKMELITDQILRMIQQEDRAYYHRHNHTSQPAVLVEYHEYHPHPHHHQPQRRPSSLSRSRRKRRTTEPPPPPSSSASSSIPLKPSSFMYRKDTFDSTESTVTSHSNTSIDQVCDIDVIMTQHHNSQPLPQYKVTSAPCYQYSQSLYDSYLNHSPLLHQQFRHPSPYSGYFDGVTRSSVSSPSPFCLPLQNTASCHSLPLPLSPAQVEFWRQQMYDWCCLVVDTYHLHRECVTMTFNLLDRYIRWYVLSINSKNVQEARWNPITQRLTPVIAIVTRDDYQLWCMTCLYLAIKLLMGVTSTGTGRSTTKITIGTLVRTSQNNYSPDSIERTELDIVYGLNWYLHAPTSTSYVRLLWQFVSLSVPRLHHQHDRMEQTAHDMTQLAIVHSHFSQEKAIDIALASIYLALRIQQQMDHGYHQIYSDGQQNLLSLDVYWTAIMHHFPILQQKQKCPTFQRVYQELTTIYYLTN